MVFGEGKFHAFTPNTAFAPYPANDRHAVSATASTGRKTNKLCLLPKIDLYESLDWRDPYAFYNKRGQMLLDEYSRRVGIGVHR